MAEPRVPGGSGDLLELPCGQTVDPRDIDLGLREFDCDCGSRHAVVMDLHPLGRFVPESIVDVLRAAVDTADDYDEFSTPHLMGMVVEEFPEATVSADRSEDGSVGYALLWVSEFDARRLHEVVVELLVELMEHAVSHAEDGAAMSEFEQRMQEFDVEAFVDQYRREREFETEHDTAI
jgi:hypothetical protein